MKTAARPYIVLAVALPVTSTAAILISLAARQAMPALAIAALRLAVAAVITLPIAVVRARSEILRLPARDLLLAAASGAFLALHFGFWISSLESTSVMSSVVLVSTNPLFVGLASILLLREKPRLWMWLGILAAGGGAVVIGLADLGGAGPGSLRGDIFALLGAVSASGYLLMGRLLRRRMSATAYIGVVYPAAALLMLGAALLAGTQLSGYPPKAYLWVVLLALGPQLIGHTSYNYALKYVSATFVTVALLFEPVGATLLAIPILGQVPPLLAGAGGALILAGIFFSSRAERRGAALTPSGQGQPGSSHTRRR